MSNAAKNFDNLATSLNILYNYFEQNYISDLYLAKILDLSAKPFFPCTYLCIIVYILCIRAFLRFLSVHAKLKLEIDIKESSAVARVFDRTFRPTPLTTFSRLSRSPVPSVTDLQLRFRRCLRRLTPELNCGGDEIKRNGTEGRRPRTR